MFELFALAPVTSTAIRDEIIFSKMMPPDHDVVEHAHMVEQRQILEVRPMPSRGRAFGLSGDILPAIEQLASVGR